MRSNMDCLQRFALKVFIFTVMMVLCLGVGISSAGKKDDMITECQEKLETTRNSNSLLIETNARLTTQLDAGKLDQLASGTDLKDRLSECEFRTRELEDEIVGKQDQITELEIEIADYSINASSFIINTYWNLDPFLENIQTNIAEDTEESIMDSEIEEIE